MRFYLIAVAVGIAGLLVTGKVVGPRPAELVAENHHRPGPAAIPSSVRGG